MTKKKDKLSLKREAFCRFYTSQEIELFGNGKNSYVLAYGLDLTVKGSEQTARANASRLLAIDSVMARVNELLEMGGFNDENVEKQHLFLLNQHANLPVKQKAVDSYYKLKGKNEPDKIVVETKDKDKADDAIDEYLNDKENTTGE